MTIQERVRMTQGKRDTAVFEQLCGVPSGVIKKLYNGEIVSGVIKAVAKFAEMPVSEYMRNVDMGGGATPTEATKYPQIPKEPSVPAESVAPKEQTAIPAPSAKEAGETKRDYAKRLIAEDNGIEAVAKIAGYASVNFLKASLEKAERPSIKKVKEQPIEDQPPLEELCQTETEDTTDNPDKVNQGDHTCDAARYFFMSRPMGIKPVKQGGSIAPIMYRGLRHFYSLKDDPHVAVLFTIDDNDDAKYTKEQLLSLADELTELAGRMEA